MSPRKPKVPTDAEVLAIVKRYGWYIEHAFDFRKREIEKQCANARKLIASEPRTGHPRDEAAYESLEGMASHLEWVQREFNDAHDKLREVGIK